MKKILFAIVLTIPLCIGCQSSMLHDGSYSNEYKPRVIGHMESEYSTDTRVFIVRIDDAYYYATQSYAGYWNIGPVVPEKALKRHKERLDF